MRETEYIYWARAKGDPEWKQTVVLEMERPLTEEEQARLIEALAERDMEFVHVSEFKGEAPDFAGTVRI